MEQIEIDQRLLKTTTEADALSAALNADIIFFSGDLRAWYSSKYFVETCREWKHKHPNAAIIVVTSGGSADAGYKIARFLQSQYKEVYALVLGHCKSAGTLIVSGAHKIYMGDFGELGPLDVQISKKDELWESTSGLNVDEAVQAMENTAEKMFFQYLSRIKTRYRSVTFRTAAEVSTGLIEKILGPIAAQIDPKEIGENSRAMDITKNYATRLNRKSGNFKDKQSIDFLVQSYPDHGFVIDLEEAQSIFKEVHPLTKEMEALDEKLGDLARDPIDWSWEVGHEFYDSQFLSTEPQPAAAQQSPNLTVVSSGGSGGTP
jgi:hypothetical protein